MNIQQKIDELQKQIDQLKDKQNRKIYFLNRYFIFENFNDQTNVETFVLTIDQVFSRLTFDLSSTKPRIQFAYYINNICILNLFGYNDINDLEKDAKDEINKLINRYSTFIEIEKKYTGVGCDCGSW